MTVQKPAPFKTTSRLGVIAPASAPLDMSRLDAGLSQLSNRGVEIVFDSNTIDSEAYLAASDLKRAASVNAMLSRTDLDALCAVRGGYGALRILDKLDYEAAAHHAKLLIGYSDLTVLHFALYKHSGWTGVHGPMIAVDWPDIDLETESHFWRLAGGEIIDPLLGPSGEHLSPVQSGTVEGALLGGNLASIVRLLGTPYLPSLHGAILFLEEVGERPYRIDALLAQLKLANVLDHLGGVVLGAFTECDSQVGKPSFSAHEVLEQYFKDAPYPVAKGLQYGHIPVKASIPFGILARLEVSEKTATLSMLESVTHAQ